MLAHTSGVAGSDLVVPLASSIDDVDLRAVDSDTSPLLALRCGATGKDRFTSDELSIERKTSTSNMLLIAAQARSFAILSNLFLYTSDAAPRSICRNEASTAI